MIEYAHICTLNGKVNIFFIFTSRLTKAIHTDMTGNQTVKEFILVLRWFVTRQRRSARI